MDSAVLHSYFLLVTLTGCVLVYTSYFPEIKGFEVLLVPKYMKFF